MKILIASDLHWPTINGIATFGRNLAQGLAARGHEVIVVAPSQTGKKGIETDVNHRVYRTSSVVFPFYNNLRVSLSPNLEINRITKEFKPDVIHVQTPLGIGLGAIGASKKYHVPLLATNHSMSENLIDNLRLLAPLAKQLNYILRQYGSRFYGNADFVTLPTMAAVDMLKTDSFKKPYKAISNGVDLSRFHPAEVPKAFYTRYGIPMDEPVVMYLGRLDAEKHVSVLLKAAHKVLETTSLHLVIVGDGNDVPHLTELTRDLGMVNRVTFTGRIDEADKPVILRLATLFVMPSPAELQSIATLEAMASGKPIVVVDAGAVFELCEKDRNGYIYHLDNVDELARYMSHILDSPQRIAAFGEASLEIAHRHDLETTITEFEKLYEQVIRDQPPKPKRLAMLRSKTAK